jgi:hypothetical protein
MVLLIGGMIAFAAGLWIGFGAPGRRGGREDRYVPTGARRLHRHFLPLDWWRIRRR